MPITVPGTFQVLNKILWNKFFLYIQCLKYSSIMTMITKTIIHSIFYLLGVSGNF